MKLFIGRKKRFLYSVGQVKYEEKLCRNFRYPKDFDEESFNYFLTMAKISPINLSTEDILTNMGVAVWKDSGLVWCSTMRECFSSVRSQLVS